MQDDAQVRVITHDDGSLTMLPDPPVMPTAHVLQSFLKDLPEWAKVQVERGAALPALVGAMGDAARTCQTVEDYRSVFGVAERLAVVGDGRHAIDDVLTPAFMPWLLARSHLISALALPPSIILYDQADISLPGARIWLTPWEDEAVYPVAKLQAQQLDQSISAVWQDNFPAFSELFLFGGADLRGSYMRFARVKTPVTPLPISLAGSSFDNQTRSVLGSIRSGGGRRFSATDTLTATVTLAFSNRSTTPHGTMVLTQPPRFSWDGYALWLAAGIFPNPKVAGLTTRLDFRIDDVAFGSTHGTFIHNLKMVRPGVPEPVMHGGASGLIGIPQPWRGDSSPPNARWGKVLDNLFLHLGQHIEGIPKAISQLAGPGPGSILILPGHSTAVPTPPATHWGLVETGHTDDDATIVLLP